MTSRNRASSGVKDVAALAGVSLGTVSNVLNRPDRVSEPTRLRVLQAMADLGFVRNESARQLRVGMSRTLAYVVLDAGNPFFTDVASGMEEFAEEADLSVFLCNTANRAEREHSYLDRLEQQRVQGILITPVDPEHPSLTDLTARGTPVVIVDRTRRDRAFCSVAVDDVLGGRLGASHLLERGHRRLAFVGGPRALGQVRDRLRGTRSAVRRARLPSGALTVVDTTDLSVAAGRQAAERITALPAATRPTAVVCANDLLALGLLQQCVALGVRVPEQLAIVGYDDIEFAGAAAVPLSSVRQPRAQLGRKAVELLYDETHNPDHVHEQILYIPERVGRASTS